MEQIKGRISSGTIGGAIKRREISGNITIPASTHMEYFQGPYEVTPKAYTDQTLATNNKTMTEDLTVFKVPYFETANLFDGRTAYIANEV